MPLKYESIFEKLIYTRLQEQICRIEAATGLHLSLNACGPGCLSGGQAVVTPPPQFPQCFVSPSELVSGRHKRRMEIP